MGAAFPAAGVPASRQAWNAGVRASGLRSLNLRPLATSSSSNFAGLNCGPCRASNSRLLGRPWGGPVALAVVQGAAAVHGPAVAVDPHHVDVGGTHGHALLQDLGALVDHGIDAALQDLVVRHLAGGDALLAGEVADHALHQLGRLRRALPVVVVEAGAGLLAA